jgi:hypothetical protein
MTQINPILSLPDFDWNEQAQKEIALNAQQVLDQTTVMYQVGEVAVIGLIYRSLALPPWMWFALTKGVGFRQLVDFRMLARKIPYGTATSVAEGWVVGNRFAKFYGFVPTEQVIQGYRIFVKEL